MGVAQIIIQAVVYIPYTLECAYVFLLGMGNGIGLLPDFGSCVAMANTSWSADCFLFKHVRTTVLPLLYALR